MKLSSNHNKMSLRLKSQGRSPKAEGMPKSEGRTANDGGIHDAHFNFETAGFRWAFCTSRVRPEATLGLKIPIADFGFRASAFGLRTSAVYQRSFRPSFRPTVVLLALLLATNMAGAEPFIPKDGKQVLERLRATPFDPVTRRLRDLRTRLSKEPGNLPVALELARLCIERSRADADPRYLGHAQAAISHWWNEPKPPPAVLVLRATLKQSLHDFSAALADLGLALKKEPDNAQAWLTRATILSVVGQYPEARRACLPLARLAPGLVAITATATVASLTGEGAQSCSFLRQTLARDSSATTSERLWALTILAETAARLGRKSEAEEAFHEALALGQSDAYLLGAYADFLLDQGRATEAAELLKSETRADPLLLRLALAEDELGPRPASFSAHVAALQERFEESHLRGDSVHRREEARFTLRLLHLPEQALRLAKANWEVQREPADARILLESALAAHEPAAAQPVLEFLRNSGLEDVQLARLKKQLVTFASK